MAAFSPDDLPKVSPPRPGEMQIAWATDAGYASRVEVAVFSLLRTVSCPVRIVVICTEDARGKFPRLEKLITDFPLARLEFVFPDVLQTLSSTHSHKTLPAAAFGRLLIPHMMTGRVLYLDADIWVRRDVAPLAMLDLGDCPIAAGRDFNIMCMVDWIEKKVTPKDSYERGYGIWYGEFAKLGIPMSTYINSGVMLMDCDALRDSSELASAIAQFEKAQDYVTLDQCLINVVFLGRIAELPSRWNAWHATRATAKLRKPTQDISYFEGAMRDPAILHYYGRHKPWKPVRMRHARQGLRWILAYKKCEWQLDRWVA